MFKSQLQEYAQKAGWSAPVYDISREGPSHEPKFKAVVTVENEPYESPAFYPNLKKAEHAAAEVALTALSVKPGLQVALPNPLHESGLCKNLLQEYAQKCKLAMPVYNLIKLGETHSPMFSATVEIAGVQYKGGLCKNKKEAEIRAAKTALIAICSDLGGSPEQAFENQLSSVGQETAPPEAAPQLSPKPGTKRRKNNKFRGYKRGKKAHANEAQGQETEVKEDGGQQGDEVAPESASAGPEVPSVVPEVLNANVSTEIPGITVLAA